jgi:arginyl-tRNA synthetase
MDIIKTLTAVLARHSAIDVGNIQIEFPENEEFGDFSTNIAMKSGGNPRKFAEELADKLRADKDLSEIIEKIDIAGPGFINFWLKNDVLLNNLIQISKEKEKYGQGEAMKGKKLMVEYAHPNTHKAFHIGHLRNITTGETLCRIFESQGAQVIRANYQGDIGLHIAKALYGIQIGGFEDPKDVKKRAEYLGKVYALGATKFEETDGAKEEVSEINKKIYDQSDPEINKLYKLTRQWSLDYFESIYERVYTKFDRLYFESECADSGKKIAMDALKKGILTESEGAIIFKGSDHGLHDRVFISGKGVPTYEAKDLGLAKLQFGEHDPDRVIHTVGPEQTEYFKVVFKALELIEPETKGREEHIPYGWVRLKEGKMSSRTGNVILGEWLLDQAKEAIMKEFAPDEETAEAIAVGAVKYSFLKNGLSQDIAFDLKESISLEGNSGPYLQYTVARINSLLAKSESERQNFDHKNLKKEMSVNGGETLESEELSVLRTLVRYGQILENAAKSYSPNLICNYVYNLAQTYNSFYNKHKILGSEKEEFRITMSSGVAEVIKSGLLILGINAPEKM